MTCSILSMTLSFSAACGTGICSVCRRKIEFIIGFFGERLIKGY